ncbi:MAG: hypothetical protein VYE46_02340 [Cyanobacteriota bacterium]|nr:hypothetical protein [Cyanobacteriota bacterium]
MPREITWKVMWHLRVLCWNLGDGESLISEFSEAPLPEDPQILMEAMSNERPELKPIQANVVKGIVAVDEFGRILKSNELSPDEDYWLCKISHQQLLPVLDPI